MLMAILLMSGDMCEMRNGGRRSAALCAACVLAIVLSGMPNYGHYLRRHDADAATRASYRQTMEELLDGYGVPAESSYYVLVDEDFPHTSLLSYMTSYLTLSDAVETKLYEDPEVPPKIKRLQEVGNLLEYDSRIRREQRASRPEVRRRPPEPAPPADEAPEAAAEETPKPSPEGAPDAAGAKPAGGAAETE